MCGWDELDDLYEKDTVDYWRDESIRQDERIAALESENARLHKTLKSILDMADEDIREGTEGAFTAQIEADARAVLAENNPPRRYPGRNE
jgi:hypothetical protein